jgi:hypothetical protein
MQEIQTEDRNMILNNYSFFTEEQLNYWHLKLCKRIDYLRPLNTELSLKGIDLFEICKPLSQEVFEIRALIELLINYKFKSCKEKT